MESLFALIDIPYLNQVYVFFRAKLLNLNYAAGEESLEVKLIREAEVPWDTLAFPAVTQTLEWFFEDRKIGSFKTHTSDIRYRPRSG